MLILKATQSLEVILAAAKATNDCPVFASWCDDDESTGLVSDSAATATNGAAPVTVVAAPTTTKRQLKAFTLVNADTASVAVTIRVNVGGTPTALATVTLPIGYSIVLMGDRFAVLDTTGAVLARSQSSGGGGVSANIDGGSAASVYGGTTGIDGGGA